MADLGRTLSIDDVVGVARARVHVQLDEIARARMMASRAVVERLAALDAPVYGINTGFGALADVRVSKTQIRALQQNLVRSHAAGVGDPLPVDAVRAMMFLRANVLALGASGVRPAVVDSLVALLNAGIQPVIPSRGSVGASGDLAPLAHLALALIGEGEVTVGNNTTPVHASDALRGAGVTPLSLEEKEGLALVNGTQAMTALGTLAIHDAERLAQAADVAGAMTLEALLGTACAFDPRIHALRPHIGQTASASHLAEILATTPHSPHADSEIARSHENCGKVQDPYSLRCMPQVHGATRNALAHARETLTCELNAVTDNPLVFADTGEIVSGGNFHGQPIAFVLDYAAIAMTALANISERRIEQLVNPHLNSGLPAFLVNESGLNSGFMLAQVTAASLVNECKVLSTPASVDSIPSSANREDHVSMGMTSALKLRAIIENVRTVLAIELLAAAQGIDFRRPLRTTVALESVHARVRAAIPRLDADRVLAPDIAAATRGLVGWTAERRA
ncbi:MAG: histidine ammonia-lyase [Deltaproteobacteria bacterium]|nr:histidine ammonia-lyase [Deltaproteobacteria bacterium]